MILKKNISTSPHVKIALVNVTFVMIALVNVTFHSFTLSTPFLDLSVLEDLYQFCAI